MSLYFEGACLAVRLWTCSSGNKPCHKKTNILHMRKQDADQLCGNREADQRLCFHYIDSTIPLLSKSEISSLYPSSVAVQPDLCRTRSETRSWFSHDVAQIFLMMRPTMWHFVFGLDYDQLGHPPSLMSLHCLHVVSLGP